MAARRPHAARRDPDPVRRRRQPQAGEPIPRDPAHAQHHHLDSLTRPRIHPHPAAARPKPGELPDTAQRQCVRRLGRRARLLRVHAGRASDLQRQLRTPGRVIPRVPSPMDRATDYPPVDRGQRHESRRPGRLRQLERGHQRRPLAADRGPKPEPACTARPGGDPHRLRDRDRDHDLTALPRGRSARQLRTSAGHIDRPSQPRKDHDRLPEDSGSLDAEAPHTRRRRWCPVAAVITAATLQQARVLRRGRLCAAGFHATRHFPCRGRAAGGVRPRRA